MRHGAAAEPPGWDGEQRGEPGIHGVARPRRWDAVVVVEATAPGGELHAFAVLGNGAPVRDGAAAPELTALARPLAAVLAPPFRAEAVARGGGLWAVGGRRIRVERLPDISGSELQLVRRNGLVSLDCDGRPLLGIPPGVSSLAAGAQDVFVRARHLYGEDWEVDSTPL